MFHQITTSPLVLSTQHLDDRFPKMSNCVITRKIATLIVLVPWSKVHFHLWWGP